MVWTREEDIRHDIYRPVYRDVISASLSGGKIVAWKYRVSGSSIMARWAPSIFINGIDIDAVDSAVDMPYDIPNRTVEYVRAEPPAVPTGFWRGVGPNNNVFAIECFMDELARKAGMDPIDFRRGMLGNNPRLKAALDLVAEKSDWGKPLPPRAGRGVCVQPSFASFIATVVEAEVADNGEVRLRRVTSAVDTGIAVNPDTIVAQLQGGLIFGLTAALYGEITIDKGRVRQSNFNDYRMLRIDQVPNIDVHVIKSGADPGGIGETGCTAGPPALRNAIYAATGVATTPLANRPRRNRGQQGVSVMRARIVPHCRCCSDCCGRPSAGRRFVPDRWHSPAVRRLRWRIITAPIRPAFPQRLPMRTKSNAANISRAPPIAWSATPRPAAPNMPAAWRFRCHSGRFIPPTSRPTRIPASAITAIRIFSTPCNAASDGTARGFIRPCRLRPIPT